MHSINSFLDYTFSFSNDIELSVKKIITIIVLIFVVILITNAVLKLVLKLISRNLPKEDGLKFNTVFSYFKWFIYVVIFLITLSSIGVNITAVFAASTALLIGVGLALQTFFQDIICGIFILIDQSVHVGDIIEIDSRVGRVEDIKLRTTRAVTIDNKVLVIPNHLYLTNSLYNWTQNGALTREYIDLGVAYDSDVQLVKRLLMQAAETNSSVLKTPKPQVLFTDFGDNALKFRLIFTVNDSFQAIQPKSDIRFEINTLFKKHNIKIPFPQRDVHLYNN